MLHEDEASIHCSVDKEKCELCLSYADKIPYKEAHFVPGAGNAANNAVGAARLGLNTALYSILGKDKIGQEIKEVFKKEGVDISLISHDNQPSNFNVILSYKGERTILTNHHHHNYDLPEFETKWIYFSSLAKEHENIHEQIPNLVKSKKIKMGFNPGTLQLREGAKSLDPILKATEILILNREEAEALLNVKDKSDLSKEGSEIKELLEKLLLLGPKMAIITDGSNGSYSTDGKKHYKLGIHDVKVVERTGAGDAYSTGVVSALALGKDLKQAMRWGTFNSASVVQKIGSRAGLLTKAELEKMLKENSEFKATPLETAK